MMAEMAFRVGEHLDVVSMKGVGEHSLLVVLLKVEILASCRTMSEIFFSTEVESVESFSALK